MMAIYLLSNSIVVSADQLEFRAYGTKAFGFNPDVEIYINKKLYKKIGDIPATSAFTAATFKYDIPENISELIIVFPNDAWQSEKYDRDLYIDYVKINDQIYQLESNKFIYDRGNPFDDIDILPNNQWVYVDGFLKMGWGGGLKIKFDEQGKEDIIPKPDPAPNNPDQVENTIKITAKSSKADKQSANMLIYINNTLVKSYINSLTETFDTYEYVHDSVINPQDIISIYFNNDYYDPVTKADRNLYLQQIELGGKVFSLDNFIYDRAIFGGKFNDGDDLQQVDGSLLWTGAYRIRYDGQKVIYPKLSTKYEKDDRFCDKTETLGLNINPIYPGGTLSIEEQQLLKPCYLRVEIAKAQEYEKVLKDYTANGSRILAIFDYALVNQQKPGNGTSDAYFNQYLNEFESQVKQKLDLYGQYIDTVEIWNEPDLSIGIDNTNNVPYLPPDRYAKLVARVAPIIKERGIKVIFGAFASGNPQYLNTFNKYFGQSNYKYIDAISIHPYGKRVGGYPSTTWGFGDIETDVAGYRKYSNGKDIWITEFGYNANPSSSEQLKIASNYVGKMFDYCKKYGYIDPCIYFAFSDDMVPYHGLHIADGNGTGAKKPVWYQFVSKAELYNK